MFNNKQSNSSADEDKLKKRAEILYKNTKVKEDDTKGELSVLNDKDKSNSKTEQQSVSDRTSKTNKNEKDYEKTAELLYPSMKSKNEENEGRDAKNAHKELELDEKEYQIKDNKISPVKKQKEYVIINNIKFPNNTDNAQVEELKRKAKSYQSEYYKEDTERYLKRHAFRDQFGVDHISNPLIKFGGNKLKGEEAAENLHMSKTKSYMDTDYAKQNKIYNNYSEVPDNLKDYFKDKITRQIGADKLDKTKGIFVDANSKSSNSLKEALLQDSEFIKKLKVYDKALNNNYSVDDSINFKNRNWHNALGHADIKEMHINKNGDTELYITDVYDFNEGEKSDLVRTGRNRQDKGEITPYFALYRVIIPKAEKEQILKNYSKE